MFSQKEAKGLILIVLALNILTATAHSGTHQCIHDQVQRRHQEMENWHRQINGLENQDRRSLATAQTRDTAKVNPIRITFDTSKISTANGLTQDQVTFINSVSNAVAIFFKNFLKVNPIIGNNILPTTTTCSDTGDAAQGFTWVAGSTDSTTGIPNSDLHIYLTAIPVSGSTLAWAKYCKITPKGPEFGRINFNPLQMAATSIDSNDDYEYWTEVTVHEVMHVLGFSGFQIENYWVNPATGAAWGATEANLNIISSSTFDALTAKTLKSPNVLAYGKDYFACDTLGGIPLENEGGSGSLGSHWERSIMGNDCMTASATNTDCYFTRFDIAVLKDTNYYALVDEDVFETGIWGRGQGCPFITEGCTLTSDQTQTGPFVYGEFCKVTTPANTGCSEFAWGQAVCINSDPYGNGGKCAYWTEYSNTDCSHPEHNLDAGSYLQYNGNVDSRCFMSDIRPTSGSYYVRNTKCFKWSCNDFGDAVRVNLNNVDIDCPQGQTITPNLTGTGYTGTLTCPRNARKFCDFQKHCLNKCSKNGFCVAGMCYCNPGFSGEDCSQTCSTVYDGTACVAQCPAGKAAGPDRFCRTTAPLGFFINGSTVSRCHNSCRTCNGLSSNSCLSCPSHMKLQISSCVLTCSPGFTADQSNSRCTTTCATCPSGQYQTYTNNVCGCSACASGCASCINGTTCSSCPTGKVLLRSGLCGCHSSCTTCNGLEANNCLSCSGSLFFKSDTKECVSTCAAGLYGNTTNNQCTACPTGCSACTSATNCSACTSGYTLNGTSCSSSTGGCHSSCLTCTQGVTNACLTCPTGKVLLSTSLCGCDVSCATCNGQTSSACLSCPSGKFLNGGTCVSICPSNTFANSGVCTACPSNCLTCTSATACQSCTTGYALLSTGLCGCDTSCSTCNGSAATNCLTCSGTTNFLSNGSCVATCPSGTFANSAVTPKACSACNSSCLTCDSATNCVTCPTGQVKLASGLCGCDASCLTCNGTTATNCLTCASGRFLDGTTCLTSCPSGQYANGTTCSACNSSCTTCNSATTCLTCPTGKFLLSTGLCGCDSSCATCSSGTATSCLTCTSTTAFLSNGSCIAACPAGTYGNTTVTPKVCTACVSPCANCTSQTTCTTCVSGKVLLSTGSCGCDVSCATCSGTTASNCLTCPTGQYLSSGACLASCPSGTTPNASGVCTAYTCNSTCATCNNSQTCLTCPTGKVLLSTGLCGCNASCATCNGTASTNCLTCANTAYFVSSGSCVAACPTNTLTNSTLKTCTPCTSPCATCTNSVSSCTSCTTGTILSGTSCVVACPANYTAVSGVCKLNDGFFLLNGVVTACATTCATCVTSATNCTKCKDTTLTPVNGSCLCPAGKYMTTQNVCAACPTNCASCSSATTCLSCLNSYVLASGACTCPTTGYFLSGSICTKCSTTCQTCTSTATQCTSCPTSFTLSSSTCVCAAGTYLDVTCKTCPTNCATCSSLTKCLTCKSGYTLRTSDYTCQVSSTSTTVTCSTTYNCLNNLCLASATTTCQNCKLGYIFNSLKKCVACTPTVTNCLYCNTSASNCSQCQTGYLLSSDKLKCTACTVKDASGNCISRILEGNQEYQEEIDEIQFNSEKFSTQVIVSIIGAILSLLILF